MATIVKRTGKDGKTTSYLVRIRLKGHPSQTATFPKLAEAKAWAAQTETEIRQGKYFQHLKAKHHTLNELIERYCESVLPQKRASTQAKEQQQLDYWKGALGQYTLADITPSLIAEARDQLSEKGLLGGTINRYLKPLSHAFSVAQKEYEWVQDNPVQKVRKFKNPQGRLRYLSEEEIQNLLKACQNSPCRPLYTIVLLALSTGMRKSEIMYLTWQQIDLESGRIILEQTKNNERRILPLLGEAKKQLETLAKQQTEQQLLFAGRSPNKPFYLQNFWQDALQEADIKNFHFHDLRHTAASYLAMSGVDLLTIAEILGHKTLAMAKRYTHLSDSHKADALSKLNQRLAETQN